MALDRNGLIVLTAGSLLAFVFGSVHAFSVFLEPLEMAFAASRADVSLTYSISLIAITAAVTLGHHAYPRLPAWGLVSCIALLGAIGAALAGSATSLLHVWIGYGAILGFANGLGYGFSLQLAAQWNPGREGFAMGWITAFYALGATVFTLWFNAVIEDDGFAGAMHLMVLAVLAASFVAVPLLAVAGVRFKGQDLSQSNVSAISPRRVFLIWLAYGTAVAAGLMATGHATGIARSEGVSPEMLIAAPIAIAVCNVIGSLAGGWLTDRFAPRPIMIGLPLISALALMALATAALPQVLLGLGLIGLIYGAVISVYPAVIAHRFGVAAGVRVYGYVFTAWAVAGLGGPWLAGWLYDTTGGYTLALAIAAVISMVSAATSTLVKT